MANYKFFVAGIRCAACAVTIKNAQCDNPYIKIKNIRVDGKTVTFSIDDCKLNDKEIKDNLKMALEDCGFEAIDENQPLELEETKAKNSVLKHVLKGILGILCGSLILGLCISGLGLPLLALYALAGGSTLLTLYLGKESYYEAGLNLLKFKKRKAITMDTLFSISTLIAITVSLVSLFVPWLPMMFDAALLIFGFSHIGKALKEALNDKIEKNASFRSRVAPTIELEKEDASTEVVKLKTLLPGDIIIVRRGELIPVDGESFSENGSVYSKIRSGKTLPERINLGDPLYAGFKVPDNLDYLKVKVVGPRCSLFLRNTLPQSPEELKELSNDFRNHAYLLVDTKLYYFNKYNKTCRELLIDASKVQIFKEKFAATSPLRSDEKSKCLIERFSREQLQLARALTGHLPEPESYLALLDARLSHSEEEAPLEKLATTIMKYFVPLVLFLALASALVLGVLFSPLTAIQSAIAILVSACPCTFGLITPLVMKIGIAKAAADGVRFKSGLPLQAAQEVTVVVLDLNGTLTKGRPQVSSGKKGIPATNIPFAMLPYLAAIEQQSSHPFAKALRHYIYQTQQKSPDDLNLLASEVDHSHRSGVIAKIKGESFAVGNKRMMLDLSFSEAEITAAEIKNHEADQVIYFARGNKLLGTILLRDPLRKGAVAMVADLKRMGKKVHICTGADQKTADKYAKVLGIDTVIADRVGSGEMPGVKTKVQYIEALKQQGYKAAMVGDEANDTEAIKAAHLGIAIHSDAGDKNTQQEAGVVISKIDGELSLRPIVTAFAVANQTIRNLKQNLVLSLSYNLTTVLLFGCLMIALGFAINPALGAALMVLQALFILANVHRFAKQKVQYANDSVHGVAKTAIKSNTNNKIDLELRRNCKISMDHQQQLDKALGDKKMQPKLLKLSPAWQAPHFLQKPQNTSTDLPEQSASPLRHDKRLTVKL